LVKKLFEVIGPRFKTVEGGYTRLLRLGKRKGDGAQLSRIELTLLTKKEKKEKKEKKQKPSVIQKTEEKAPPRKEKEPKKGLISGVRKIFKKDRGGSK
jgi:large subunit ribosomal protein L17